MEQIINQTYNYLKNRLKYQKEANMTGGQNRTYSGNTVELTVENIINMFKERYPTLTIEIRGDNDKIK